jgi:carbonic anhydrase/acetyltransferase-like protein (isoleucine patch superfamily)
MATIVEFDGVSPTIGDNVYLAPTAVLIGDVRIADGASVWFGAVLRGDFSYIEVGAGSAIQDNCVLHCADDLPTVVGRDVIVGHGCILEGCLIEDEALVGMGSIVCQHARVGAGAMLAAGSVVSERAQIPNAVLAAGVPASRKKELEGAALSWTQSAAAEYHRLRDRYLSNVKEIV